MNFDIAPLFSDEEAIRPCPCVTDQFVPFFPFSSPSSLANVDFFFLSPAEAKSLLKCQYAKPQLLIRPMDMEGRETGDDIRCSHSVSAL